MSYDVVVIGSGPGGYIAAARAGALGLKTVVVEKDKDLGGTCLHRGCIPTKALLHAADVYGEIQEAAKIGIVASGVRVEWDKVMKNKQQIVKSNAAGVAHLMKGRKVEVKKGFGKLNGPGQVVVTKEDGTSETLQTKNVIIATGSKPREFGFAPFDGKVVMSSDHILDIDRIPGSLCVIGGGVIGIEFASLLVRLGTKVTVLEALDRIVTPCDLDMSKALTKELERQGCEIKTGVMVKQVENKGDHATVSFDDNGTVGTVDAEVVLVSAGRPPLTENIGLETTRAKLDPRGFIEIDGMMQSAEPGIYAIGDCVNTPWLAHIASSEGIIAAEHIAGDNPAALNYDHTPCCIYSEPPLAWSGLTEAQAKEQGYDIKVSKFDFARNAKAAIIGKKRGFVKFITDKKFGEILGVHIIGPQATDLLAEPALAMALEIPIDEVAKTVHAHPTLYEAIYEAAAIAAGRAVHG
ncbi:MAG: dihydrolipoyl dehydrogenase [Deltaproteobacteria bacterium]|nr:dihydrolipoyl dehydrogenase [Deltaproteobacteria bacterium]